MRPYITATFFLHQIFHWYFIKGLLRYLNEICINLTTLFYLFKHNYVYMLIKHVVDTTLNLPHTSYMGYVHLLWLKHSIETKTPHFAKWNVIFMENGSRKVDILTSRWTLNICIIIIIHHKKELIMMQLTISISTNCFMKFSNGMQCGSL